VDEAGTRLKQAEDAAAFERCNRALSVSCRNLRQTIAMKQRFDREQANIAAERRRETEDARKAAEDLRREAERAREAVVARRRWRVRSHFERVLWDEYEDDDAQEIFNDLDKRLAELAEADDFRDTPVETVIARLMEEFEIGVHDEADEAPPKNTPSSRTARSDDPGPSIAASPLDPGSADRSCGLAAGMTVEVGSETVSASPQPRPPDPPPDPPYLPPWERNPHAIVQGGSGW
jgi:hypothetical protein